MSLPARYANAHRFTLANGRTRNDRLLAKVLSGEKTATCDALAVFGEGADKELMPKVGRIDVVLNSDGMPACAIQTINVHIYKFKDIPSTFTKAEGIADHDAWCRDHIDYYRSNGGWTSDMKILCEKFKLIEVFAQ